MLRHSLLERFARKVTADRDTFEHIAPVVSTFLCWLQEQGILPHGERLSKTVEGWSDQIVTQGMDPKNWGMGKRFAMQAQADGVNTTDADAMKRYMHVCNARHLDIISADRQDSWSQEIDCAPFPIVDTESKTGRNDPCPCGSGKKFKKCCGAPHNIRG